MDNNNIIPKKTKDQFLHFHHDATIQLAAIIVS